MYIPPKEDVDRVIDSLERVPPRQIAREAVAAHRSTLMNDYKPATSRLSQRDIDGSPDHEIRYKVAMSQVCRFHRRSLAARLLNWMRRK
jgi:hypothetical protein